MQNAGHSHFASAAPLAFDVCTAIRISLTKHRTEGVELESDEPL